MDRHEKLLIYSGENNNNNNNNNTNSDNKNSIKRTKN